MLERLIGWSLAHRGLVLTLTALLAGAGALAFSRLPFDAFPDTTPVQVQVNATAPALAPVEVERQVTYPVEQSLAGLKGLEELRSISKFGLSQVTLVFDDSTPVHLARQQVAERLARVELPEGVSKPAMGPVATGLGEVFHYLVRGKGLSLSELRAVQDWIIAPQLRAVPGVAEVNSWGGEERQIHVVLDPRDLAARGLRMADVVEALRRSNVNVGGGVLARGGSASLVLGVARLTSPEEVGQVVVTARDGVGVRIADLAVIREGAEIRRGSVTAAGAGEAVLGLGFLLLGENSREVTRRLRERLEEVRPSLPPGVEVAVVYERTDLVDQVLATVRRNLAEGALLVAAILFLFLGSWRAGLVVASVIPLSLLFAGNAMLGLGIAGTLMSLGAIDFGLVVDSSVILVENAVRRLALEGNRRSVLDVVRDAAVEVRRPTLFGELIILVVYLPVLALEGVEGKLFRPMALTVMAVLGASMLLSLTAIPALASLALARRGAGHGREPWIVRSARRAYLPLLEAVLGRPALVLVAALLALAGGGLAASRLGGEFVPRLSEQSLVINTIRLASVSLEESTRYGSAIERVVLEAFPDEVARVWTRTGTAEVATDPMGLELSDVFLTLRPRDEWRKVRTQDELVTALRGRLSDLPGMRMVFTQPIEMRVNEMIAGARSDVVVKLFGDDLEVMKAKAAEIQEVIRTVAGSADSAVEQVTGQPVLEVKVDRDALARHGVHAAQVTDLVQALGPVRIGDVLIGERRVPLAVRLSDAYRAQPDLIGALPVTVQGGGSVPLSRLASLRTSEGPSTIQREWGKRRIQVQSNVRDRDVASWVEEARRRVEAEVALPAGYYVRWGGQFEHLERARGRLAIVVPVSLLLVLLLLQVTYGRWLDALRVFTGVPFAAVGGILALHLRGMPFSVPAGVGFIALSGVSVLADMVLVSTVRQFLGSGMTPLEAVRAAAGQRLRPVLMTGLVAAIGFLPMALSTGVGAEVQRPLATVVIGGLLTSTLLSLIVLPVLYVQLTGRRAQDRVGPAA